MNERCFALQATGRCRALDVNCPGHAACAFYKPRWKHEKDQQLAYCKIAALPVERQQSISQKYYKGLMPWEDVQV